MSKEKSMGFFDMRISLWHVIVLVMMAGSWFAQAAVFQAKSEGFQDNVVSDLMRLDSDVHALEERISPMQESITEFGVQINHMERKVDNLDSKVDRILEELMGRGTERRCRGEPDEHGCSAR